MHRKQAVKVVLLAQQEVFQAKERLAVSNVPPVNLMQILQVAHARLVLQEHFLLLEQAAAQTAPLEHFRLQRVVRVVQNVLPEALVAKKDKALVVNAQLEASRRV